ncbi:MAG TPA: hypothetical protein PK521_14745 [Bacteroidales bacterium]|nr:hypothetical protein [Bacteroidales bacterium]HQM70562.1 hypothetical protein [Bacteroidales bacterium]
MKTEIIIHNSVSIDGSITGFMPDMGLHYKIAGEYKLDAHLIGADTVPIPAGYWEISLLTWELYPKSAF